MKNKFFINKLTSKSLFCVYDKIPISFTSFEIFFNSESNVKYKLSLIYLNKFVLLFIL